MHIDTSQEHIQKKGLLVYLLITFGIAWLDWLLAWFLTAGAATSVSFSLLSLPAAFTPALATVIVRHWVTREGFHNAGLRPHLKKQWRYYIVAYLWPMPVVGILLLLDLAFGLAQPDFSLQRGLHFLQPGWHLSSVIIWLLHFGLPLITLFIIWGEEFGWQGYLLPSLRSLLPKNPLLAVFSAGAIWGLWHIPLHIMGYFHDDHVILDTLLYVLGLMPLFLVMSWLRLKTGSVWASSLAHASMNSFIGSLVLFLVLGGGSISLYGGILGLIPQGVICGWIIWSGQLALPPQTGTKTSEPRVPVFSGREKL